MNVLSVLYSSSIMYLDPRGHDSSPKDKKPTFGRKYGRVYTCYKSATGNFVFSTCKFVLEKITHRITK